jgi:transcriptional regulator of acetoin/glycerol metabolism
VPPVAVWTQVLLDDLDDLGRQVEILTVVIMVLVINRLRRRLLGTPGSSRTVASRILGVSRKALWEKCKRYGISSGKNGDHEDTEED